MNFFFQFFVEVSWLIFLIYWSGFGIEAVANGTFVHVLSGERRTWSHRLTALPQIQRRRAANSQSKRYFFQPFNDIWLLNRDLISLIINYGWFSDLKLGENTESAYISHFQKFKFTTTNDQIYFKFCTDIVQVLVYYLLIFKSYRIINYGRFSDLKFRENIELAYIPHFHHFKFDI